MMVLQQSLLANGEECPSAGANCERIELSGGSWVELTRGFWGGADRLMADLVAAMPWKHRRRRMYDRMVDDPRLSCRAQVEWSGWGRVEAMRKALGDLYEHQFSAPFLNFYRDG